MILLFREIADLLVIIAFVVAIMQLIKQQSSLINIVGLSAAALPAICVNKAIFTGCAGLFKKAFFDKKTEEEKERIMNGEKVTGRERI